MKPKHTTLVELLRSRAYHQPDQLAFVFLRNGESEQGALTFGELDRQARIVASQIQQFGVDGERILLLHPPGMEFVRAFFGTLYAGATAIPAYPPHPSRLAQTLPRLQAISRDARPALVLTTASILSLLKFVNRQNKLARFLMRLPLPDKLGGAFIRKAASNEIHNLENLTWLATDKISGSGEAIWRAPNVTEDSLAFLQYTSGSTGTPKGVMITHGNLLHNEQMVKEAFGHSDDTVFVGWLPLSHDMGLVGNMLQPVYLGIPSILMSPLDFLQKPVRWLKAISHYNATTSGAPNFAYDLCVRKSSDEQRQGLDLSSWQVAFNGAEPVSAATIDRFSEEFEPYGFRRNAFFPCYGLAEATLFVTGGPCMDPVVIYRADAAKLEQDRVVPAEEGGEGVRTLVGCGRSWQEEKVVIADPVTLTRSEPGHVGEIWVAGPNVARGYWERPEETTGFFKAFLSDTGEGPFLRTGDLGFLQGEELFVTGRLKDLVIIRGRNHYPQDIEETVVRSHQTLRPGCGAAFSLSVDDEERLVVVQEIRPNKMKKLDADQVIEAIRRAVWEVHELQIYALALVKARTIPKTSSGKIQRRACRELFLSEELKQVASWIDPALVAEDRGKKQEEMTLPAVVSGVSTLEQRNEVIQTWLVGKVAPRLKIAPSEVDVRVPFADYGIDSAEAVSLAGELEQWLGQQLAPTLVYDHPTIESLAAYLAQQERLNASQMRPHSGNGLDEEPIAVIGLGCRFPGAYSPEAFWDLLIKGVDAITEVPPSRWDVDAYYDPGVAVPGKMNTRWGGFLNKVDEFDPHFFGISPLEAQSMDPQHRLLLEVSWEALEDAGIPVVQLAGSQTGVFVGISTQDYAHLQSNHTDMHAGIGNALSIASNRLSYLWDLRGPSLSIDTACSSSLVAVHQAIQSLRQYECTLALVGGVNLILMPDLTVSFSQLGLMASDGRCKSFDAAADGYVRSEGCGVVVLQRYSDAIREGSRVLAVIRGSAVNHDGRSNGLTAPNTVAQQAVIRQALKDAKVSPAQINFVEAHGTGTALGDPIEINSLKNVLMEGRTSEQFCYIGSVKSNIGHLEAAAGIAGLMKVVLALQHSTIPPNLHLKKLNPHIHIDDTPLLIPTRPERWHDGDIPRLAGVSSFGFGGTNAHIILEQAPPSVLKRSETERLFHFLSLSARTESALKRLAEKYAVYIVETPDLELGDICYSANTGRTHFEFRLGVSGASAEEMISSLSRFANGEVTPKGYRGKVTRLPKLALFFTGDDLQIHRFGRELYETQPLVREILHKCEVILRSELGDSFLSWLISERSASPSDDSKFAKPGGFAIQIAIAQLWISWGIKPVLLIGSDFGEIAAACTAGIFSLEDGFKLAIANSQLTGGITEGENGSSALKAIAQEVNYKPPKIPFLPYANGQSEETRVTTPAYWSEPVHSVSAPTDGTGLLRQYGIELVIAIESGSNVQHIQILEEEKQNTSPHKNNNSTRDRSAWEQMLESLSILYMNGLEIDWNAFDTTYERQRIPLPTYPFQRKSYWLSREELMPERPQTTTSKGQSLQLEERTRVLATLRDIVANLLHASPDEIDVQVPFLQMGADSIVLIRAVRLIQSTFGVDLAVRQFFEETTTLDALATYIADRIPRAQSRMDTPTSGHFSFDDTDRSHQEVGKTNSNAFQMENDQALGSMEPGDSLEDIFTRQLQMVSDTMSQVIERQLEFLREKGSPGQIYKTKAEQPLTDTRKRRKGQIPEAIAASIPIPPGESPHLDDKQQRFLDTFIRRYTHRTQRSKEQAQKHRFPLADNRASAGFRFPVKEILYPIVGERSQGSRIWDVDGNEYIDIGMGFGVHLFGHNPTFVTNAIEEQMKLGMHLGPRSNLAGEVAELLCEITELERVIFCTSGTEAVMTAMRLARTKTGRNKIALFEGSYHGHFDGTLGIGNGNDDPSAIPLMPGITPKMVDDLLILEYGDQQSLEIIREHRHELAGVLVEPVQSRRPDLQPREFLRQLREVTKEANIPLIFDEIITGFRILPGGAQSYFGVKADLATYGKVIGGGLPVGVIAGTAEIMDGLDGGAWQFGDNSYPQAETTFFASTFSNYPLLMSTSRAVLRHIKEHGARMYEELNERTRSLSETLNTYFDQENVPIRVTQFGSLFRFVVKGNFDLLFYLMLEKGIYTWEGRTCFLSTAHSDEDVDRLIAVIKESVETLREEGFLVEKPERNFDLTEAQKQLWVLDKMDVKGSLAYHLHSTLQLKGSLNRTLMREALDKVVERHEILRVAINDDGLTQRVLSSGISDILFHDFSGGRIEEREKRIETWFKEEIQQPFILTKGPLFRLHMVRLEKELHLMVLVMHHIIADGWSMQVVLQELAACYSADCQGEVVQLDTPLQFGEYVRWQQEQRRSKSMALHRDYWVEQLSGSLPVLDLPTDHMRPSLKTYQGDRKTIRIQAGLRRKLKGIGESRNATLFMTLFTAYTALLHRLTWQDDLLVGISVLGRPFEENRSLVGYCTHLLPIRSKLDGELTFEAHLNLTKKRLLDAYEHQAYPFAWLINDLGVRRDGTTSPLISTVFNLDHPQGLPEIYGTEVELVSHPVTYVPVDISLDITEIGDELVIACDYNTDIFQENTISRILDHYQILLKAIVTNPKQQISALDFLSQEERRRILDEWNETSADYPRNLCISQLFEEHVEQEPSAPALLFQGKQLTYLELNQRANQLAGFLHRSGLNLEEPVAVFLDRSPEAIIALLGIWKAGGAYMPLDPSYPTERLGLMLKDAKPPLLLSSQNLVERLPDCAARVILLDADQESIEKEYEENLASRVKPDNLAYLIYTSGSTGKPKGSLIEHRGLINLAQTQIEEFGVGPGKRVLQFSSPSFDASIFEIVLALCSGATLCLAPQEALMPGSGLVRLLRELAINIITFPPSVLAALPFADLPDLEIITVAGQECPAEVVTRWSANRRFFNLYGPTEATIWATMFECSDTGVTPPIGKPISNARVYLLDKALQPVPVGMTGELCIGGIGVGRGYLNRPNLTTKKFVPDPYNNAPESRLYRTGDLARYLPDGNIKFLGRIDHQVKLRGYRIELGEIEAVVSQHPDVVETVVLLREDLPGNQQLVAYYIGEALDTDLRAYLEEKLPRYMIPSAIVPLDAFPLTSSGKIDRQSLPRPSSSTRTGHTPFASPEDELEQLVASIWQDILQLENISVYDNFFEVGGHSLLATQVQNRLEENLGKEVPIITLFQYPTIRSFAQQLREERDERDVAQEGRDRAAIRKARRSRLPRGSGGR